jgi:hypothetical protein
MKKTYFLDTECYPNYFLVMFKDTEGNTQYFEKTRNQNTIHVDKIKELLSNNITVGFNSKLYDMPMIEAAFKDYNNDTLKYISDKIINEGSYKTLSEYRLWMNQDYDHIDLMNVAIGKASLKMYGARINTPFLRDLPYDPSVFLSFDEMNVVRKYCENDLNITKDLYDHLQKEIDIRININEQYDVDVRSKSDAQIAEELIAKKLKCPAKTVISGDYDFYYNPPSYIEYKTEKLKSLLDTFKSINFKGKSGDKLMRNSLIEDITINNTTYSLGIGGIHSTESKRAIEILDDELLIDIDVVSYYPTIILNNGYAPINLPRDAFLKFYRQIYHERIEAKKKGDKVKSDVFKIILNGSFGKFGDQYSRLYSPSLLIHTTVTGQLSLLMLIEELEEQGFKVVSSNTDGITVHFKKAAYDKFKTIVVKWEQETGFETEEIRYKALYNQSVNSYIAVKEDGKLKCKGVFADNNLARNPAIRVCKDAIFNYLLLGIKPEDTIYKADKIPANFLTVKKVTTGAYWYQQYLGKVVRWYWSTNGNSIYRKLNKTEYKKDGTLKIDPKIAESDDAYPIMDLNVGLSNIYYDKYIRKTYELMKSIGIDNG